MTVSFFGRFGAACAAIALLFAGGLAHADTTAGKRLKAAEISRLVAGATYEAKGNNSLAFEWDTWIRPDADGTFAMVTGVEWLELLKNEPAQIHKLDENGKWWVENDRLCLQFMHRASGARDCFDVMEEAGQVRLVYSQCTMVSTDRCKAGRAAYVGKFVPGNSVPIPDKTN